MEWPAHLPLVRCGGVSFFEIENMRSFDCTPSSAMKSVMENFSSGISIFNDSTLNLWTYDLRLCCELCFMVKR